MAESLKTSSTKSNSSSVSENEDIKIDVRITNTDKNEKKPKGRKHQIMYYISDEDLHYLKKKTRFNEGEIR